MSKNLVLVESPSKAKTINKYLGSTYKVEATVGHIRNLPKTKLGVDIENNFEPQFLNIRGKGDLIKKIKADSKKSDKIFIATDPDREGEAIAQDIVDVIKKETKAKIYRVLFHEITRESVKSAIKSPIEINSSLVSSQRARRVLDRIIGYKISPFLWSAIIEQAGNSLSAGRVQSVALRLICEREEEIENFTATEYWTIEAVFKTSDGKEFIAKLHSKEGKPLKIQPKPVMTEKDWDEFLKKNFAISDEKLANSIVDEIKKNDNIFIKEINKKEVRKNPPPPFITSTLQAEASRKLRMAPRKTMRVAQSLYEGVDLGDEGFVGLITYMRTDSTRINLNIAGNAKEFIDNIYGSDYSLENPNLYGSSKNQNVQDAHEAIRPTSIRYTPAFVRSFLNNEQFKLYEIIWNRFIASQMQPAIFENTQINVEAGEYIFRATGSSLKFDGFMKVYQESSEENGEEKSDTKIPLGLEKNQTLNLKNIAPVQHFTKPPARYTESSLIKELESNGIGRPSTYALIIGTLVDREYVNQIERKLSPTKLGREVNSVLIKNFDSIFNVNFTAAMEKELDLIANGEISYEKVLSDFYSPFNSAVKEAESKIEKVKCDKCGSDMDIKIGRFGKFLACTNYPDCKNIKSLREAKKEEKEEPEYTGENCPKCGSKTIFRNSRYGRFIGCEKYPDCDYTKQITLDIKCPKCKEGEIIARKSKRGKTFYGCNRYPDCDFISWTKPKSE